MLEQEYKEKSVILDKIRTEIVELNLRKSGLVNEINLQLIDTKSQADKIISEAKIFAQNITAEAQKIKEDAVAFSEKTKQDASEILHIAKAGMQEVKDAEAKFLSDKEAFNNFKFKQEQDIETKENLFKGIEERQRTKQIELDKLIDALNQKEIDFNNKVEILFKSEEALKSAQAKLIKDLDNLNDKIDEYNKLKISVDSQKATNDKTLVEIKILQEKLIVDTNFNQSLLDDIARQNIQIAEDKKTINAQFELIEKNQKELEEKAISLGEWEKLIGIKNREVNEKISLLKELRSKEEKPNVAQ